MFAEQIKTDDHKKITIENTRNQRNLIFTITLKHRWRPFLSITFCHHLVYCFPIIPEFVAWFRPIASSRASQDFQRELCARSQYHSSCSVVMQGWGRVPAEAVGSVNGGHNSITRAPRGHPRTLKLLVVSYSTVCMRHLHTPPFPWAENPGMHTRRLQSVQFTF